MKAKENFQYHNEIIKKLSLSNFKQSSSYVGEINGRGFQITLYHDKEFTVFVSKLGNREKVELLQDFHSTPWLFYGDNIRFEQFVEQKNWLFNKRGLFFKKRNSPLIVFYQAS